MWWVGGCVFLNEFYSSCSDFKKSSQFFVSNFAFDILFPRSVSLICPYLGIWVLFAVRNSKLLSINFIFTTICVQRSYQELFHDTNVKFSETDGKRLWVNKTSKLSRAHNSGWHFKVILLYEIVWEEVKNIICATSDFFSTISPKRPKGATNLSSFSKTRLKIWETLLMEIFNLT